LSEPIPKESLVLEEGGRISNVWHQFLYKVFDSIFKRLDALESTTATNTTAIADHETRIDTLEP